MSIAALTWASSISFPGMRLSERILLRTLADYATAHGNAWPQITALVRKTGLNRRTIQVARNRLSEMRLMSCRLDVRGAVTNYALNLRWQPADDCNQNWTANQTTFLPKLDCESDPLDRESDPPDCESDSRYCESDSRSDPPDCESDSRQVESVKQGSRESVKTQASKVVVEGPVSSPARTYARACETAGSPPPAPRAHPQLFGAGPALVTAPSSGSRNPPPGEPDEPTPAGPRQAGPDPVAQMVAIWNETVRGSPLHLTRGKLNPDLAQVLLELRDEVAQIDLSHPPTWRTYCHAAVADPYLRGEHNGAGFDGWTGGLRNAIAPRSVRRLVPVVLAAQERARLDARDAAQRAEREQEHKLIRQMFPDYDPNLEGSMVWQQAQANAMRGDFADMEMLEAAVQKSTFVPSEEELANYRAEQAAKQRAAAKPTAPSTRRRKPVRKEPDWDSDGGF